MFDIKYIVQFLQSFAFEKGKSMLISRCWAWPSQSISVSDWVMNLSTVNCEFSVWPKICSWVVSGWVALHNRLQNGNTLSTVVLVLSKPWVVMMPVFVFPSIFYSLTEALLFISFTKVTFREIGYSGCLTWWYVLKYWWWICIYVSIYDATNLLMQTPQVKTYIGVYNISLPKLF